MIEIKLSFTSIDEAIAYLARNKTDAGPLPVIGVFKKEDKVSTSTERVEKAAETAQVETPKPAAVSSQPETAAASPASSPEASASAPAADAVDYPTLQKAVFALAGKSREAAGAVAATLGVKTFKKLPDTRWGEALTAVLAKSAELEAARS